MVRNTYIFPPEPSMKLIGDIFSYTSKVFEFLTWAVFQIAALMLCSFSEKDMQQNLS